MLIASAARREQNVAQASGFGALQRFTYVRQEIRRLGIVIVLARNLKRMPPYLRALCLVEDHVVIRSILVRKDQWNQEKIERSIGDFSQLLERQRMHSVSGQNLRSYG